ncbi:hypothetical protein HD599_001472 [Conyzicola lurida]|uniref:Uncharacterized protein n=1 Tax=Conyzicola lurida TaxID=1172621 RepID=A0A841AP01_9MICO|nr:hypothetical protein [Conyzicola lurida]MBB5843149.1 hypothetical protein [Conyzicola lurida]
MPSTTCSATWSSTLYYVDREATAEVPENLTATEIFWTAADATD